MISRAVARKTADAVVSGITGADVTTNANGTATYSTDQGTVSTVNQLPSTWPADAPKYPDATVAFSGSSNSTSSNPDAGLAVTLTTTDDVATATAFYKTNLVKEGWTIDTDATLNGSATLSAKKDTRQFGVMISPTTETGKTGSTLVVSITTNGSN